MSVYINTIRHTIMGKKFADLLPVVDSKTRSTIEGYMEIKNPTLLNSTTVTPGVWECQAPTTTDGRYIRTSPSTNLYETKPNCLVYNIVEKNSGRLLLFWRFFLEALGAVSQDAYYSVEFQIEDGDNVNTANTPSVKGQVIIKSSDSIN